MSNRAANRPVTEGGRAGADEGASASPLPEPSSGNGEQTDPAGPTTTIDSGALIALADDRFLGHAAFRDLRESRWWGDAYDEHGEPTASCSLASRVEVEDWFRDRGATSFVYFRLPEPRTAEPEPSPVTTLIGTKRDILIGTAYRCRNPTGTIHEFLWGFRDTAEKQRDAYTPSEAESRLLELGATRVEKLRSARRSVPADLDPDPAAVTAGPKADS